MNSLKSLAAGFLAILFASVVLLVSDRPAKRNGDVEAGHTEAKFRIAVLQHASQPIMDDGYAGLLAGLAEGGYSEEVNLEVVRRNNEGDIATANLMAQEIVGGDYDLAVSLSTPSLQALASANKNGRVKHVFAMVTDPSAAGVGVGLEPLDHPSHMAGLGTMQPVAESLKLARRMHPGLKTLGVVWNPAEINSEINTKLCRAACLDLSMTLLEANCENTSAVREAALSLLSRNVDAIWIGGDVTVLAAAESVIGPARDAHVPVFTVIPGTAAKGALFDMGANYYEVGRLAGVLASRVLGGESPVKMPVERIVPPKLFINTLALKGLRDQWKIPDGLDPDAVIDEQGMHEKKPRPTSPPAKTNAKPLAKTWRVHLLEYVNLPDVEAAEKGVLDGIRDAGLKIDRDYTIHISNAQGDMATLNGLVDAAVSDHADMIVTLSTPTLQAATRKPLAQPVVFTFLADPVIAGVAKSDDDHLPNVTGSYGSGDMEGMVDLIRNVMPQAKRIGTMFCPAEVNSVFSHDRFVKVAKDAKFEIVPMGVSTPAEVSDTATALCSQKLDLICLPTSNMTASSFPSIAQAATKAKIPVFGFLSVMIDQGATAVVARDYYDMGRDAGDLAARVMRGEKPQSLPLKQITKSHLMLNRDAARKYGVKFSDELLNRASKVVGQ